MRSACRQKDVAASAVVDVLGWLLQGAYLVEAKTLSSLLRSFSPSSHVGRGHRDAVTAVVERSPGEHLLALCSSKRRAERIGDERRFVWPKKAFP